MDVVVDVFTNNVGSGCRLSSLLYNRSVLKLTEFRTDPLMGFDLVIVPELSLDLWDQVMGVLLW